MSDSSSPFCCHSDSFSRTLKKRYTHKVKAKQPGQSEKGKISASSHHFLGMIKHCSDSTTSR